MLAQYLDLTEQYNNSNEGYVIIDVSNYDYVLIQSIGASGGIDLLATIDSGAITGISDGSADSAINFAFNSVTATYLTGGNTNSQFLSDDGIYRLGVFARYLVISGGIGSSFEKLLIMLTKIS